MTEPSAATGGITSYLKGLSPKAKQYLVLGGLGMGFIGLVFGSIALWDKQPPSVPQSTKLDKTRNIVTPGAQVDPRWHGEVAEPANSARQSARCSRQDP